MTYARLGPGRGCDAVRGLWPVPDPIVAMGEAANG